MTYQECYQWGAKALAEAGVPEAGLDARLLLEYVCKTDYNTLLVHGDRPVAKEEQSDFEQLIGKRGKRIPLQHLTGEQDFYGLTFRVNEHVLIPRQDTEILVEAAQKKLKSGMTVIDMCTGSGCILISLISMIKKCNGIGVDISPKALIVARENAARLLDEDDQPKWFESDLFESLPKDLIADVIVSNPPYIPSKDVDELMPEVRVFEPRNALDGSEDGLFFYRRIISESGRFLREGGFLLFEIGYDQGEAVSELMRENGYSQVEILKDYAGLDRVVTGQRC